MTNQDLGTYSMDLVAMVRDLPSFSGDSYVVPLAGLDPTKARADPVENQDVLILLAIRKALALYGSAQTTEDEREYLVTDTKRILELDPDTNTTRNQVQRAFDTFRDEHDPERREVEAMESAWCLILQANRHHLHKRLVSEYSVGDYAKPTPLKKAS